ncbi:hypothetical protein [Alteromonas sp. CYL-A6]|uniref:hypothetical protein n=1 Tax=Alteromonas nitratireducens TaxID=3390813 RepID=UPI0034B6578D
MKRNRFTHRPVRLKNNNQRRLMLKRAHQRVLKRRRLFVSDEMFTDLAQAS